MKTFYKNGNRNPGFDPIDLNNLVNKLTSSILPMAVDKKSFFINDIRGKMMVCADEDILASVLSILLNTAVSETENNCIRISTKMFGNIVLLYICDNCNKGNNGIANNLFKVETMAEKLGGCLTITNNRIKGNTIRFRLSRPEVEYFGKEKHLEESVDFGDNKLLMIGFEPMD